MQRWDEKKQYVHIAVRSRRVRTIYLKAFSDLPVQSRQLTIVLQRRVFFCKNSECEKSKFAERFSFVDDYGRRTKRLNERIIELAASMSALKAEGIVSKLISRTDYTYVFG